MAGLIYKKMNDVMMDIGHIGKDKKNEQQGFKFRGIDQFVNALHPALTKHGVFMTTEVLHASHELKEVVRSSGKAGVDKHVSITMKYTFHAEDGSSVSSSVPAEGLDSGDKATNKALSAALKYALIQTFSVPTEDMEEGDRTSPEMSPSARPRANLAAITAAIEKTLTPAEKKDLWVTTSSSGGVTTTTTTELPSGVNDTSQVAEKRISAPSAVNEPSKVRTTFRRGTPPTTASNLAQGVNTGAINACSGSEPPSTFKANGNLNF